MGIYLGTTKVDMKSPIKDVIPGLSSENIKGGTTVGGVEGKTSVMETENMTATAADMLEGVTGAVNGQVIEGSIPRKATETYTPSAVDQTIERGQYLEGDQIIKGDPNLVPENIVSGQTLFGVEGNYVCPVTSGLFHGRAFSGNGNFTEVTVDHPIKMIVIESLGRTAIWYWLVGFGLFPGYLTNNQSSQISDATNTRTVAVSDGVNPAIRVRISEDYRTAWVTDAYDQPLRTYWHVYY